MLMGNFRDEANDLELFFSPVTDEQGKPLGYDRVCFVSPLLKINFLKEDNKVTLRADETG